jgi:hypothetical protein
MRSASGRVVSAAPPAFGMGWKRLTDDRIAPCSLDYMVIEGDAKEGAGRRLTLMISMQEPVCDGIIVRD